jgi:hypothetical protein
LNELLIIAGLALAGYALRTFASIWMRRLGSLVVLAATFRLGSTLTDGNWGGWLATSLWFLVPAGSLVVVTRRSSFPLEKQLRYRQAPSDEEFPELAPLTEEFLQAGFELHDDIAWDWANYQQFTRLFVHPEHKLQGAIHLHTQETMLFSFVSVTSRTTPNQRWITWNSPFQSAMSWPPGVALNEVSLVQSVPELVEEHQTFCAGKFSPATVLAPDPEGLLRLLQEEGRHQVDHNLNVGLLKLQGNGRFTYSWKGCWYMVRKLMIDLVRLS